MAERVFPASMGWWLVNPLRKLALNPRRLLGAHIKPGMTVLEPGCGMGFFSLPAARLAGPQGRVICVDLQAGMIAGLQKRAAQAGLSDRIELRVCAADSLRIGDLQGKVDFAFAVAVVHEVPDDGRFFREIGQALKPGGRLLFIEPKGHVTAEAFEASLGRAKENGLAAIGTADIAKRTALLGKAGKN
ncbi:MAG: class I SAM-dependent methyltransferase [candidate division FCPU426 bacterium]